MAEVISVISDFKVLFSSINVLEVELVELVFASNFSPRSWSLWAKATALSRSSLDCLEIASKTFLSCLASDNLSLASWFIIPNASYFLVKES